MLRYSNVVNRCSCEQRYLRVSYKLFLASMLLLSSVNTMAANFSFTGSFIDPNEVQYFSFKVATNSTVTLKTLSYGGGTNNEGNIITSGGFDTVLSLYRYSGVGITREIIKNDNGWPDVAVDPVSGFDLDSHISRTLTAGNYTAVLTVNGNWPSGNTIAQGFTGNGNFHTYGTRTQQWAFDISNVEAVNMGQDPLASSGTGTEAVDPLVNSDAVASPDNSAPPSDVSANSWKAVIGAIISAISANKHDELIEDNALKVLQAIDGMNSKFDNILSTICNIYEHQNYANYFAFKTAIQSYLSILPGERYKYYYLLNTLQTYMTEILRNFEDHYDLLSTSNCGIDQHSTLELYMAIAFFDFNLTAEYVRMTNYLTYRPIITDPDLTTYMLPLDQMTPTALADMDAIIESEIQSLLGIRLNNLINHFKVIDGRYSDGTPSPFSWKTVSDRQFTDIKYWSSYRPAWLNSPYIYRLNGEWYRIHKLDMLAARPIDTGFIYSVDSKFPSWPGCGRLVSSKQWGGLEYCGYYGTQLQVDGYTNKPLPDGFPSTLTTYPQELAYLNTQAVYNYYRIRPSLILARHQYDVAIEYIRENLSPKYDVLLSWLEQVSTATTANYYTIDGVQIARPRLIAMDHMALYKPTLRNTTRITYCTAYDHLDCGIKSWGALPWDDLIRYETLDKPGEECDKRC